MQEGTHINQSIECIHCGEFFDKHYNYCPYCGSRNFPTITNKPITDEEDDTLAILKCFSEIPVNCGRTLLSKILKGSKDQYVFEKKLFTNTRYRYLSKLTIDEIKKKIDVLIEEGFFELVKSDSWYRRPILKLTEKGYDQITNKIPKSEIAESSDQERFIDPHEAVEKKVESLIEGQSNKDDKETDTISDDVVNTDLKASKDEIFISKEKWSKLYREHLRRDKKKRNDFEKDGGVF